jgi:hypothetical protein
MDRGSDRETLIWQNIIYFTIHAPDVQGEPTLEITPTEIKFRAKAGKCVLLILSALGILRLLDMPWSPFAVRSAA